MNIRNRVKSLRNVRAADLVPNPKNWRTHPKAQADALRGILAEVGYADALLARELPDGTLMLVDGHLRAETTPQQEVPVLVLDIDEAEADKLLLSLDPLAALAETNAVALDALLREVDTGSEGLQQMYADLADAADLYKDDAKEIVEDAIPEPPADPITKPGDLWLLGDHRLLCGDSTKAEDVARLMGGQRADLMLTDPPYGMNLNTDYSTIKGTAKSPNARGYEYEKVIGDDRPFDRRSVPIDADEEMWFGADYYRDTLPSGGSWSVWIKRGEADKEMIGNDIELLWSKVPHKRRAHWIRWVGWAATERDETRAHPTQKPIRLLVDIMQGVPAQLVADPFLGSGTTLIAAEQLGRTCYGMEISPAYCDVIVKRWETLTGKKAELEVNDGQARPATGADDSETRQGKPRQKAAERKRTKTSR